MMYWVIFPAMYRDGAVLSAVPDVGPQDFEYDLGKPLLKGYPKREDAIMCFDTNYPDRIKLYDILPALDSVLVVNSKVKDVFEASGCKDVEYLPITIWDHQNAVASSNYFIVNPLGGVDFIDMDKSAYSMSSLDEGQIYSIDNLVINEKEIPADAKLFRAKTKMDQIFISDEIRKSLEVAGIKGYKLLQADGWDGLDI